MSDTHSARVQKFYNLNLSKLALSPYAEIEFLAVLSRMWRSKLLSAQSVQQITTLYDQHKQGGLYNFLQVGNKHFTETSRLLRNLEHKLKAMDALHVAVARSEKLTLVSADTQQVKGARASGVQTKDLSL